MSNFNPDHSSISSDHHHRRNNNVMNPRKKRSKPDTVNKPRKPDPAAPKITRPCSECGKRFWSWKALFGHMRCHPERQWRGINPPPNHRTLSGEDRDGAASLLMLANGGGSHTLGNGLKQMIYLPCGQEGSDGTDGEIDGGDNRRGEGSSVGRGRGLGRCWALDLNFPPGQQYDTGSTCAAGLTLDLRLGL